jgi:non-specific serine/threonine protein kinase
MDEGAAAASLAFAEKAKTALRRAAPQAVAERLEERHDELLLALQWFIDEQRPNEAMRLACSLDGFWMATQRLDEGATWFDRVLAMPGGDEAQRGQALFQAGLLVFWTGDDERAAGVHQEALEIGRRIGDPTVTAEALSGLARIALRTDVEEARRLCREALEITNGTADRLGRGNALHVLAVGAQMAGDFLEARELMRQRIAMAREEGNLATVGSESGNLSMVERQLGDLDAADALAREALTIYDNRGDSWAIPYGLSGLAAISAERGEFKRAAILIGAAEALISAQGAEWPPDERPHYERTVAACHESMGSSDFEQARTIGRAMTPREAVDLALTARSG